MPRPASQPKLPRMGSKNIQIAELDENCLAARVELLNRGGNEVELCDHGGAIVDDAAMKRRRRTHRKSPGEPGLLILRRGPYELAKKRRWRSADGTRNAACLARKIVGGGLQSVDGKTLLPRLVGNCFGHLLAHFGRALDLFARDGDWPCP